MISVRRESNGFSHMSLTKRFCTKIEELLLSCYLSWRKTPQIDDMVHFQWQQDVKILNKKVVHGKMRSFRIILHTVKT